MFSTTKTRLAVAVLLAAAIFSVEARVAQADEPKALGDAKTLIEMNGAAILRHCHVKWIDFKSITQDGGPRKLNGGYELQYTIAYTWLKFKNGHVTLAFRFDGNGRFDHLDFLRWSGCKPGDLWPGELDPLRQSMRSHPKVVNDFKLLGLVAKANAKALLEMRIKLELGLNVK